MTGTGDVICEKFTKIRSPPLLPLSLSFTIHNIILELMDHLFGSLGKHTVLKLRIFVEYWANIRRILTNIGWFLEYMRAALKFKGMGLAVASETHLNERNNQPNP